MRECRPLGGGLAGRLCAGRYELGLELGARVPEIHHDIPGWRVAVVEMLLEHLREEQYQHVAQQRDAAEWRPVRLSNVELELP